MSLWFHRFHIGLCCVLIFYACGKKAEQTSLVLEHKEHSLSTLELHQDIFFWDDGVITVSPDKDIVVGSRGTWRISLTTRSRAIPPKKHVLLVVSPFWGWSPPQNSDPGLAGFTTVSCSRVDAVGAITTPVEYILKIEIGPTGFQPGDILEFTYGDTSGGTYSEAQARADRYAETAPAFYIRVGPDEDGYYRLVPGTPAITTVSLPDHRLVGTAPTEVTRAEQFFVRLAVVDRSGNFNPDGQVTGRLVDDIEKIERSFSITDSGTATIPLVLNKTGWHHLYLTDADDTFRTALNPVRCCARKPERQLFWGDLHGHSSLSDGSGSLDDYFRYARDVSCLDFCAVTDHDFHGFEPLQGKNWDLTRQAVETYHQSGTFVVFLAYEWTSWRFGHRNVYYPEMKGEVFSHQHDSSDTLPELWSLIAPFGGMTVPHHVAGGPVPADWSFHNPECEWLVEISSVHGTTETPDTPNYIYKAQPGCSVVDALNRGYVLGIMGSGDSHDGHPGVQPVPGEIRGLIAARAGELSRPSLWQSFQERAVYATSGARLYLEFTLNGGEMGQQLVLDSVTETRTIKALAVGDQYMENMVLIRDGDIIHQVYGSGYQVTLEYSDPAPLTDRHFYYVRARQMDGQMAWSSPIWVSSPSISTNSSDIQN